MPSESEHKLEGVLRAWAKKRRDEAGKRFELHPATRRLLLGEVTRTFPSRETGQPRISAGLAFKGWMSRTVTAVGLMAILVVVGWAAKSFWSNLPRYGDYAKDDSSPPDQTSFTLRRRLPEGTEPPSPAAGQLAGQPSGSPGVQSRDAASPVATDKGLGSTDSPASRPTAGMSVLADRLEADKSAGRPGGSAPPSMPGQSTATNVFALSTGPAPRGDGFNPLVPSPSTGGVVALAESLGKKRGTADADRSVAKISADEAAALLASRADWVTPAAPEVAPQTERLDVVSTKAEVRSAPAKAAPAALAGVARPAPSRPAAAVAPNPPAPYPATAPSQSPAPAAPLLAAKPADSSVATNPQILASVGTTPANFGMRKSAVSESNSERKAEVASLGLFAARSEAAGGPSPVLERFEIRQNGREIALVDADGSVYTGLLSDTEAAQPTMLRMSGNEAEAVQSRSRAMGGAKEAPKAKDAVLYRYLTQRTTKFQASGTNGSLGQPVLIEGTLAEWTDGTEKPRVSIGGFGVREGNTPAETVAASPAASAATSSKRTETTPARAGADAKVLRSLQAQVPTNGLVLRGMLRVGTNAGQPFQARPVR